MTRYNTYIDSDTVVGQETILSVQQNGYEYGIGISSTIQVENLNVLQSVGIGTTIPLQQLQLGIANSLGISTDGKIFVVTSSGFVGLGTTNPIVKLDVRGDVNITGVTTINNSTSSISTSTGALQVRGGIGVGENVNVGGAVSISKDLYVVGVSTFVGSVNFLGGTNSTITIGDTSGDNVIFNADVNSNLIPNISNQYDLGTSTQKWKDAYFSGIVTANSFNGQTNSGVGTITSLSGTNLYYTGVSTFLNGPVLIGSATSTGTVDQKLQVTGGTYVSGSVGIGTTNPTTTLDVNGTVKATSFSGSFTGSSSATFADGTVSAPSITFTNDINTGFWRPGEDIIAASTGGVERLRIDASGNVGIGSTIPISKLDVNGGGNFTGIVTSKGFSGTVAVGSSMELLRGNMANNDRFRILIGGDTNDVGYVEIATADNGTEPIYVRQYSYNVVTFEPFDTIVRTATLLDASGNTGFPGIVTATTFVGNGITPIGGIIMWSGTIAEAASLEPGWSLCDGRTVNGRTTPDLRNRFIVGASVETASGNYSWNSTTGATSGNYGVNNSGGEASHQLITAEMPVHTHFTVSSASVAYPFGVDEGVNANYYLAQSYDSTGYGSYFLVGKNAPEPSYYPSSNTGGNAYHENRPPYFALAFIMRTA